MKVFEKIKNLWNSFKSFDLQKKIIIVIISILVCANIVLGIVIFSKRHISSVLVENVVNNQKESLIAINSNARKGVIKNNDYAFFKFSEMLK